MDNHYSHADRDDLKPIEWDSSDEKEQFKEFVIDTLTENGPTHVSSLLTGFFRTSYLSPVYMGRLSPSLMALLELQKEGKVLIEEDEHAPIRLPNQIFKATVQ